MSKIRISELARQLEVKSREVIDKLHELGITEALTHSSSIDDDNAEKLCRYFGGDHSVIAQHREQVQKEAAAAQNRPERREPAARETISGAKVEGIAEHSAEAHRRTAGASSAP